LAAKISNSKIVILPDAGHFFPIEVAEAASQAVIDFAK
jgi:pimeloyl-ACP methyl ester carboxylesterase